MRFLQVFGLSIAVLAVIAVASFAASPVAVRPASVYFPIDALRSDPAADADLDAWLTQNLEKMRLPMQPGRTSQPSLWMPPPGQQQPDEDYRALISYDREYLMAIRAFRNADGLYVQANEVDFRGNGSNRFVARRLTNDEWTTLTRGLTASSFWGYPPAPPAHGGQCPEYVLEARQGAQYRIISLACPPPQVEQQYKPLIDAFQQITGWYAY